MNETPGASRPLDQRIADHLAVAFSLTIVLYAAGGPIAEAVRWWIEASAGDVDGLPRRERLLLLREHWLGLAWGTVERRLLRPTGMILGLPVVFGLTVSALSMAGRGGALCRWFHRVMALIALSTVGVWIADMFATDAGLLPSIDRIDYVAFVLASSVTLYLTWRLFGGFIAAFCLFWILYLFVRGVLPEWSGLLRGSNVSIDQNLRVMVQNFWAQTGGMFGQPIQVVSSNVLIFIVFGAVLVSTGAGALLMRIANRLMGGFTGGAAHASVAASALFGAVSGSAISNVVSTGTMTIPAIRRAGFRPAFASAVEAVASTGGQIMPPVMGVVAFFVAGQIGLQYRYIVVAAILPALFYYLGTFLAVYFEARRRGIGALPPESRTPLDARERCQTIVFLLPLGVLSIGLFVQPSVPKAAFYGVLTAFAAALALFPKFRDRRRWHQTLIDAGHLSAVIVVIVSAIGLIVGLIQVSGFAGRLSLVLTQLAEDGPLWLVLIVLAVGSIVLGMGLPPGATYFIIVIALSSGVEAVGVPALTLHLFVVCFAVMSTVTPPVALAAFAAAPIAGADPTRTAWLALKVGLAGFMIPFVFVFHPALLYQLQSVFAWFGADPSASSAVLHPDTIGWGALIWIVIALTLALWLVASALAGYDRAPLAPWERVLRIATGLGMLVPACLIALPALVGAAVLLWRHRMPGERASAARTS